MRELSLFSGAGGGLLATKHLLEWTTIGYVENESYCQAVIRQRISDGLLDSAPIFSDIRDFISQGYAKAYQGMVDVITAGFPCQPFSVAGKRQAQDDSRNMWPQTIETIRIVKPKFAFLENVPGLLSSKSAMDEITGRPISYCATIFRDLAEAGYYARHTILGADDVGAIHRRKRLWILAHTTGKRSDKGTSITNKERQFLENQVKPGDRRTSKTRRSYIRGDEISTNPKCELRPQWEDWRILREDCGTCQNNRKKKEWCEDRIEFEMGRKNQTVSYQQLFKSCICRMDDELASQLDRLKAIGNGQFPQVAATAWEILKP